MCTADMATMVHSDTCSLLHGETLGKPKKLEKPKDPTQTLAKPLRITKKTKKTKDLSNLGRGLNPIFSYYRGNSVFW